MSVPLTKPFQSPLQMRQKKRGRTGRTRESDIAQFSNMCICNDTAHWPHWLPTPSLFKQDDGRALANITLPDHPPISKRVQSLLWHLFIHTCSSDAAIDQSSPPYYFLSPIKWVAFHSPPPLRLKYNSVDGFEIFNSPSTRGKRGPNCSRLLAGVSAESRRRHIPGIHSRPD